MVPAKYLKTHGALFLLHRFTARKWAITVRFLFVIHFAPCLKLRPFTGGFSLYNKKTRKTLVNQGFPCLSYWQGQKDLNPRHAVLETAALPTELYPYILVGLQGLEPGTDRL